MAVLSLKVRVADRGVVKTMQFDPCTLVFDALKIIREKMPEANTAGPPKDFGLFLADEDPKKGVWMENGRTLEYYLVRSGDLLEYKKKTRTLRVRMLDGTVKTLLVDDSQPVNQLMVVICTRIGIANHEEYSMVREIAAEREFSKSMSTLPREKESKLGTLTLGRSKEKKMEQLRHKLHTDEEINWVDHSKTLREQGVDESETLLLRRKYFFSDQNVDSRDPVQLNLLYVQCRDGVIDGSHPVSRDEAFYLAGLQCQNQFGDYQDTKNKHGWLEYDLRQLISLTECLPKEYAKGGRESEKIVIREYQSSKGVSEIEAKLRYVQKCRSLKTYGVTFFLVKEKMRGKNKLVPRLLGINRDCVMRVDEKTKEVLKIWPLEQVRRWAASPNTFTLDFGDYVDAYYSVQTADGEKIAQLIAGYIDIILKKKRAKDHFGIEGDEGSTMLEDVVSPGKLTLMSHGQITSRFPEESSVAVPGVLRPGVNGELPYGTGSLQPAHLIPGAISGQMQSAHPPPGQKPKVYETMSKSQRALVGTIDTSVRAVERAELALEERVELPPMTEQYKRETLGVNVQQVSSQLASMGAATAQVVQLTGVREEIDHPTVGAAVSTIGSNMPDVTKGVKTIAALMEDRSGDDLLQATRKLCGAFSDFLTAVSPEHQESRQTVLAAASRVGDFSHAMMQTIEEPTDESKEFQDILVELAKAVATSTAHLVLKAKNVSSKADEKQQQDNIIHSATQCAFATSQLVACARVVAPTIDSPACKDQLIEAAKQVAKAVEGLLIDAEGARGEQIERPKGDLKDAAAQVTRALNDLLLHIKTGPVRARSTAEDQELETIITSTDRLITYSGSSGEMVRQAKYIAEKSTHLVSHIRGEAEDQSDAETKGKLIAASRKVADATSRMIDAAKQCAGSPQQAEHQMALKMAAEDLRSATTESAASQLRLKAIIRLEYAAKQTAAAATQTIAAAHACETSNRNPQTQRQLADYSQETADHLPHVIGAVRHSQEDQTNIIYQTELITVCKQFLNPGGRLVASSRAAGPSIGDPSSSTQLSTTTQHLSECLVELRTSVTEAEEACSPSQLEHSLQVVRGLRHELSEYDRQMQQNRLYPQQGETPATSASQLTSGTKAVGGAMAQLLSAAAQGDDRYVGISSRDAAEGLQSMTKGIHGVCATRKDCNTLIGSGQDVMTKSEELFEEVRICLSQPGQPDNQNRLARVARAVTYSLNNCLSCLPGQQDLDSAVHTIESFRSSITISSIRQSNRDYQAVQDDLLACAQRLSEATTRLVTSVGAEPHVLADGVNYYIESYKAFNNIALEMASHQKDAMVQEQMVAGLQSVCDESVRLMISVKNSAADPDSPSLKQQLTAAARAVTDSINRLIDICMSGAPWQKECDNAIRSIQMMRHLLENPVQPVNDSTYFECFDMVTAKSKSLGDGMQGITRHTKHSELDGFCRSVKEVADSVCGLAECAAQSAYLVGVSDPSSTPGRAGLIDAPKLCRTVQFVREACHRIRGGNYTQAQVLDDATGVATHTSTLANMCREASSRTSNPAAKKHFINCARDVAHSTAALIQTIKSLDKSFSDENKRESAQSTDPLLSSLDNLEAFVNSPEFASLPAKISPAGRDAQRPIVQAGYTMLDGSCDMIRMAKVLAINPRNPPTWEKLSQHSKVVSDAIKALVLAIREHAPGQAECDQAIDRLNQLSRHLDQASLAAINQSLSPRTDNSEQGFNQIVSTSAMEIQERVDSLGQAAKREAENLGHRVSEVMQYFDPLVDSCMGAASVSYNSKRQMQILDQCKTVTECQFQLINAAKDAGGNPKATQMHGAVDEYSFQLREGLGELLQSAQQAISEAGVVSGIIESISRAIARTDEQLTASQTDSSSFVDCQTRMVRVCREIARIAQEMVAKCYSDTAGLGPLALELSRLYAQLADDCRLVVASCSDAEVGQRIKRAVQELGSACIELVKQAGICRAQPNDQMAKKDLAEAAKVVSEKVAFVLAALQAGSKGTQACINAASTVSGIIGDLDTTIMFATAGTLNPDTDNEQFSDHREAILKTAKALVEDTKALVSGAASSQEQLAVAAQNAVRTIVGLSDVVKSGATALTSKNSEAQVLVINAVKDVASALANLIQATKNASGKSFNDPAMSYLKEAAKVMVTNVTSLLKTVKIVEDEHQRGTRALEAAIEAIAQEIRMFDSSEAPSRPVNPEDLVRMTKPVTEATAKSVAAGQSRLQDDIIVSGNVSRKAVSDLLTVCKAAAFGSDSAEIRYKTLDAGRDVAIKVREMLQALHMTLQTTGRDSREVLIPASRAIAMAVTDLVAYGEMLKGSDWVDPSDPSVIAENELLGAASSIEAAARKLAQLKPRDTAKTADESLNFDEQILEAAKSIAAAVQALVKAASSAQRELVAQGRIDARPSQETDDYQWSEGLISAARMVAAAVHSLCEAANALVQGHASEEKLISAAKQVASSTAQLLVACKVKADMNSRAMQRLQTAGHAVKVATEHLVRAARQSIDAEDERTLVISQRMVGGIAQMNACVGLCHFCEVHGPRLLFCCMPFHESTPSSPVSKSSSAFALLDSATGNSADLGAQPSSPDSEFGEGSALDTVHLDAEWLTHSKKQFYGSYEALRLAQQHIEGIRQEMCSACTSASGGKPQFLTNDHQSRVSFVSSQWPLLQSMQVMCKHACLRSLSCEVCPGSEGPIFFSDPQHGSTLCHTFTLKDSQARGSQHWYSLIVVSQDKLILLNYYDFVVSWLKEIVKRLKSAAESVFNEERKVSGSSMLNPNAESRAKMLPLGFLESERKLVAPTTSRSLGELVNDYSIFHKLHRYFVGLLKGQSEQAREIVLEGCPTQDMLVAREQVASFSQYADGDESSTYVSSCIPDRRVHSYADLQALSRCMQPEDFLQLAHHLLIGDQVLVVSKCAYGAHRVLDALTCLLPLGCIKIIYYSDELLPGWQCNMLGVNQSVPLESLTNQDSFILVEMTQLTDFGDFSEDTFDEPALDSLFGVHITAQSSLLPPHQAPIVLKRIKQLFYDSNMVNINPKALERLICGLREEWLNKSKLYFQFTRQQPDASDQDLGKLLQVCRCSALDMAVIKFWQAGLSRTFKHFAITVCSRLRASNNNLALN